MVEVRHIYHRSVAKRKACLQPEKTHEYQYLFAVQFFTFSFMPIGAGVNKGYGGDLNKVSELRDCHHWIHRQFLRRNLGLTLFSSSKF